MTYSTAGSKQNVLILDTFSSIFLYRSFLICQKYENEVYDFIGPFRLLQSWIAFVLPFHAYVMNAIKKPTLVTCKIILKKRWIML